MSTITSGVEYFLISDFRFAGGTRRNVRVAYRSVNPSSTKGTVLIPTCFGGRISKTFAFTSGALKDYHVVVVAMLGNGESSSPSNDAAFPSDYSVRYQASSITMTINQITRYKRSCPDCINSQHTLLTQHLSVHSLEAVIGFSMGGQQAYYWAVMHGSGANPFVKRAVVICGSAKTSGLNYAFLEGPASALIASHDYDQGRYRENGVKPIAGLRAFGRVYAAWVPSTEWFRQELWRESGAKSLHEWLYPPVGTSSYEKWDPEDLLVKVRMWQAGDVGAVAGDGDHRAALREVTAKMLLMPGMTDQYFSVEDAKDEIKSLRHGVLEPIPSIWGHMAGGGKNPEDVKWLDEKISDFMDGS